MKKKRERQAAKLVRCAAQTCCVANSRTQIEEEGYGPKRFFEDDEYGHCGRNSCATAACRQPLAWGHQRRGATGFSDQPELALQPCIRRRSTRARVRRL